MFGYGDNNIPIIQSRAIVITAFCLLVICGSIARSDPIANGDDNGLETRGKHPVFLSENRLRELVESTNSDLRTTRRDFMDQITGIYNPLKSDPIVGYANTNRRENIAAIAASFVSQEFADLAITAHITSRRLLAGLKVAFVKLLPLRTIQRLKRLYPSYSWVNGLNQVDLRPSIVGASEKDLSSLYSLIDARARLRAADDIISLTDAGIKRLIGLIDWFFVDQKSKVEDINQLTALARHLAKVLDFYSREIIGKKLQAEGRYRDLLSRSRLAKLLGDQQKLVSFLDRVIDKEAIDIDLSAEANSLDLPPTINKDIIRDIAPKWIPAKILKSVQDDKKVVLKNAYTMRTIASSKPELENIDVGRLIHGQADFLRRYPNV